MSLSRSQLYKILPMSARHLNWIDANGDKTIYRDCLRRHGATKNAKGEYSASTMKVWQMENVLEEQKKAGFKLISKKKQVGDDWRAPRVSLIRRLWVKLQKSEHVDSVRSEDPQALPTWWKNTYPNLNRLEWANSAQLNSLIEQLKQWCKRCGVEV